MTITIALTAILLIGVALAVRVLFREYPDSAVSTARNTLFELRSELFELAKSGAISFDHPAYGFYRSMLNAMIRYAHDVSALQLIFSALFRNKEMKAYRKVMRSYAHHTASRVPSAARKDIERIMRHADAAIFQLIFTRSIALSGVLACLLVVLGAHHLFHQARASVKERIAARIKREQEHRSKVEESIDEVMAARTIRKVIPAIRSEAARYIPQDQLPAGMLCHA